MGRSLLIALAVLLAAPATAAACGTIPAGFADDVRVGETFRVGRDVKRTWTALCVRTGGRRIVLRRARLIERTRRRPAGAIVGGAAAAGRRVAWVETRFPRGRRVVVVLVVRIGSGGRVRPVRRIVTRRDRSRLAPDVDAALTRRGELAWLSPRRPPSDFSNVVYDPPDGRPRTVGVDFAGRLAVEDRITLRWSSGEHFGFFDLPRRPSGSCPARTRYREVASNGTVRVTQRTYNDFVVVLRACTLATSRDRVIAQAMAGIDGGEWLDVVGFDRHWIVVRRGHILRTGDSCEVTQSTIDSRTGGIPREARAYPCEGDQPLASDGDPLAVTSRGVPAWVADEDGVRRLLTAGPDERVVELDRGAIEGLRARGAAIEWTNAGQARSQELK